MIFLFLKGMTMNEGEVINDPALLQEKHKEKLMEFLPVIISLTLLGILGIVGNIFTIRFYSAQRRKSSTSIFIQYLGVIDLSVCILLFASIANLAVNVYFTVGILCGLMYFSLHSCIMASVLLLWIISIDRYLKVCRPLGRQFSRRWAMPVVVLVMIFSIATSITDSLIYDSVTVDIKLYVQNNSRTFETAVVNNGTVKSNNNNSNNIYNNTWNAVPVILQGHYCTSTENSEYQFAVKIFGILDVIVIAIVLFTFIIAYGNVSHSLLQSSKLHTRSIYRSKQDPRTGSYANNFSSPKPKSKRERTLSVMSHSMPNILESTNKDITRNGSIDLHSLGQGSSSRTTNRSTHIFVNKRKGRFTEGNVTVMMATVSLTLVISFIPYFIITGLRAVTTTTENELSVLQQLALRSPFLNSIINPIVFCIFNPRYRRFLTRGFTVAEETENFTSLKHQGQTRSRYDSSSRL